MMDFTPTQFQWGGVSGGIELSDASPVARALTEVGCLLVIAAQRLPSPRC